jgi:RNA polymerase sigma factor (sigma-70 family)
VATIQRDYEALFREISPALWRALFVYAGGRRDVADDAVSEAFARALRYGEGINTPKSWLYRTAFRLAADELRRLGDRDRAAVVEREWQIPTDPVELVVALRKLTPMQRTAVFLHYQIDLPVSEVAELMGISAGAAKLHLFRGRRKLRDLLGVEEVADD